jgi:hypothetical protein
VGEKSDEVVVPKKRSNKGRQLPAEIVEGRASPEGNSRQAAVVRTLSRVATSIRLAAVRRRARGFTVCRLTFDPREEPGALAAHAGICAGGGEQSSSLPRPFRLPKKFKNSTDASTACTRIRMGSMLEADSHLALMEPVITYKRHGRVYCPGNQQAGSRGSARLANRAERLPRGGCRGSA